MNDAPDLRGPKALDVEFTLQKGTCTCTSGTGQLQVADDGAISCGVCGGQMRISPQDQHKIAEAITLMKMQRLEQEALRLEGDVEALAALQSAQAMRRHPPAEATAVVLPAPKPFGPDCPTACGLGCRWHGRQNAKLARRAAAARKTGA